MTCLRCRILCHLGRQHLWPLSEWAILGLHCLFICIVCVVLCHIPEGLALQQHRVPGQVVSRICFAGTADYCHVVVRLQAKHPPLYLDRRLGTWTVNGGNSGLWHVTTVNGAPEIYCIGAHRPTLSQVSPSQSTSSRTQCQLVHEWHMQQCTASSHYCQDPVSG